MQNATESERLYVVETKLDNVLTAVAEINTGLGELKDSLNRYATREELEQAVLDREAQIEKLKAEDARIAKKHALNVWLTGTMSAGAGTGLTILITIALGG